MLKLDFSIETSDERNKFVNNFFNENPDYKPTPHELDTLSNYILYGKDADGQSVVDRGEVEIETKYGSYAKRKAESLDELMETPGFNENTIVSNYIYRKPKPSIDRAADAEIPGMKDLWKTIDRIGYVLDVLDGKCEPDPLQAPVNKEDYSQTQRYKLKHYLIELRKQQYVLKEAYGGVEHSFSPNVHKGAQLVTNTDEVDWDRVWFYPLGLKGMPQDGRFSNVSEYEKAVSVWDRRQNREELEFDGFVVVDFTNEEHIYKLVKQYQDLLIAGRDKGSLISEGIVNTLDFYCKAAKLSEVKQLIWDLKCAQASNDWIRQECSKKFGSTYNSNYISTIFKQSICTDIAGAARLHADQFLSRDDSSAWKVCSMCGERKLRDTRQFARKAKSSDGFSGKCKECDRIVRAARKVR